jgi:hypothetical protein
LKETYYNGRATVDQTTVDQATVRQNLSLLYHATSRVNADPTKSRDDSTNAISPTVRNSRTNSRDISKNRRQQAVLNDISNVASHMSKPFYGLGRGQAIGTFNNNLQQNVGIWKAPDLGKLFL